MALDKDPVERMVFIGYQPAKKITLGRCISILEPECGCLPDCNEAGSFIFRSYVSVCWAEKTVD